MGIPAAPITLDAPALLRAWEGAAGAAPALLGHALLTAAGPALPAAAAGLSIGACETLLLALRVGTFGDEVSAVVTCPSCGSDTDVEFSGADLLASLPAVDSGPPSPQTVEAAGSSVVFRLPSPADVAAVAGAVSVEAGRAALLERCVLSVEPAGWPLPEAVAVAVSEEMARVDPAADVQLRVTCPECCAEWLAGWDVAGFVWSEVDVAARALLLEVDALAARYGWSESDILRMTAQRRRTYLELG